MYRGHEIILTSETNYFLGEEVFYLVVGEGNSYSYFQCEYDLTDRDKQDWAMKYVKEHIDEIVRFERLELLDAIEKIRWERSRKRG